MVLQGLVFTYILQGYLTLDHLCDCPSDSEAPLANMDKRMNTPRNGG